MSLLVVGALHWDVVVAAPRLPRLDETLVGGAVQYRFGGKGGNQALAAARAGANVAFGGRIGIDQAGEQMQAILEAAGVDVAGLQRGQDASGMSVAIQQPDGSYGAVIVSGENRALQVDRLSFDAARLVLLQNELGADLLGALLDRAARSDLPVILNAAPAGAAMLDVARGRVAHLIVNRVEAADLLGAEMAPAETVSALAAALPGTHIVVTLGGDGVAFAKCAEPVSQVAAPNVVCVTTHGAGDAFCGTYAAAISEGRELAHAVAAGQAAAGRLVAGGS